jgi:hypothetical protein
MKPLPPAEESPLVELSKLVAKSSDGARLLQNPNDNPICKLSYNRTADCIEIVWRKYATSPQLRYIHEIILFMLVQYGVGKILGDYTELPIIHAEDQRWIVELWLPRAIAAGLKVAASVVSTTFFDQVAIAAIQSTFAREVKVRSFRDVHSARRWLKDLTSVDFGSQERRGRRE